MTSYFLKSFKHSEENLIPFWLHRDHRFNLGGRKYRLRETGVKTLNLFLQIFESRQLWGIGWALKIRGKARKLIALEQKVVMTYLIQQLKDPFAIALAIWLRGRMGGTLGTKTIAKFKNANFIYIRKEVARALQRMSDWPTLEWMRDNDRNKKIRLFAAARTSKAFRDRLEMFKAGLKSRHDEIEDERPKEKIALKLNVPGPLTRAFPPKSPDKIRQLLIRIHLLANGKSHSKNGMKIS